MIGHRCTRIWQAEAREDGRLEPSDLASFERHAATCTDCSHEIEALRKLIRQMSSLPEPSTTELERRRTRSELLRKANEQLTTPKSAPKQRRSFATASVFAMAIVCSAIFFLRNRDESPPTFDVKEFGPTNWSVVTNESTSRVSLQSGMAAFQVDHVQNGARFVVQMPDGTIEVRGTYFVVDVQEGQTRKVEVLEGAILLRLPKFEGLLRAGERWPGPTTNTAPNEVFAVPSAIPSAMMNVPNEDSAQTEREKTPQTTPSATSTTTAKPNASVISSPASLEKPASSAADGPATPPENAAGPRFAAAMNAFSAGDYGRADGLFAEFIRDFPRDGRAEDAMFLRARARARRGDNAGAATIAREYLRAFPRGLRRPEAERIAGEP